MSKPSDIVTIALAEVGYREKASDAALDDKTANVVALRTKHGLDVRYGNTLMRSGRCIYVYSSVLVTHGLYD